MEDDQLPADRILLQARFDPRLQTYYLLQTMLVLAVTLIGILVIPIWFFVGRAVHKRQYEALECELTERTLNVRKGFLFRVQKNVPLDKITDLALNEGPILRYLGLCSLTIETAGGGAGVGTGQAILVGVMDPIEFRNAVMRQRDVVAFGGGRQASPEAAVASSGPGADAQLEVLTDIRDALGRIEAQLERREA